MSNNVQTSMARLNSLSQVLNNVSDQLSQNIGEIESALNELNWGVSAWVHDDPLTVEEVTGTGPDGNHRQVHRLEELGYEVLVFHATGTGGQSFEALATGGFLVGALLPVGDLAFGSIRRREPLV